MMRTVEVLIVIIIVTGAFIASSFFAVLPWPRQVSPINLRRLSLTTLEMLDSNHDLSQAAFDTENSTLLNGLQVALSASLPPNVLYNLTVYNVNTAQGGATLYSPQESISNAQSLGVTSDASSYLVASSNVTFDVTPEKIGETNGGGGITLYILNCSDTNGWWITGYTSPSLAGDLYQLLSPYFAQTVLVQNTTQLGQILNGTALQGEPVKNAVIVNTCGEAAPVPSGYYANTGSGDDYAQYSYTLGQRVLQYNWTWVSIVGYPFYYVSNTALFPSTQNTWGVYGMECVGSAGLNAFLQGLDNQTYSYNSTWITADLSNSGPVLLSNEAINYCNYYGIYPSVYQTATRALPASILNTYHLNATTYVFNTTPDGWNAGAVYRHRVSVNSTVQFQGGFYALGLTRTPDIRIAALGLLCDYQPRIYSSDYNSYDTSRLVVLQLGLVGGA